MAEPIKLSPEAQQTLLQVQTFQQQLQSLLIQKESLQIQNIELDKALEELKKTKDNEEVFKAVGPILIKSGKKELEKEIGEKRETIDMRLKSLEKQEVKIKEKLKESQTNLQKALGEKGTETAG